MKKWLIISLTLLSYGCVDISQRNLDAESDAKHFSDVADECLLDVRDRETPFKMSINCTTSLESAAKDYTSNDIELFYLDSETAPRHAYIAQKALKTAWNAASYSNWRYPEAEPITDSLW